MYSSSFIPDYEFLIKCEPIVKPIRAVLRKNANRCLTISELALKIKESIGLPGHEIRKSDTIVRGLGLPLVSNPAIGIAELLIKFYKQGLVQTQTNTVTALALIS